MLLREFAPMNRRVVAVSTSVFLLLLLISLAGMVDYNGIMNLSLANVAGRNMVSSSSLHRKLLDRGTSMEEPERIWGERCTTSDIVINQGPTVPLPSGIPAYAVEIMNMCITGCNISHIHLACGWFSSAHLINPKIFKRLHYNDCLVNNGHSLVYGDSLSFQYANTYPYHLSVSSARC